MHVRNLVDERALVLGRGHAVELGLEWSNSLFIDRLLIHAGAVEVADLLINGVPPGAADGSLLQNAAFDVEIALVELREALPRRTVGGDLGLLHPIAAGELVEVHAGIDR